MPGMHDRFGADHFAGGHEFAPLFFTGMTLLWLVAPVVVGLAYLAWRRWREALAGHAHAQALLADDPSAFELLRRRYVVGEIDVATFEEMTGRLLVSERLEERMERQPPLLAGYERYLRRERELERAGSDSGAIWV
jgi:uncharacterized membrane protein